MRHSNHFGPAAYYVERAVERGCIGLTISNAPPNMAPFGGKTRFLGTNPLAIGVPAGAEPPLIFDASTSVVARGKIIVAAHAKERIPEGWAVDPDGVPTTMLRKLWLARFCPSAARKARRLPSSSIFSAAC